MGSPAWDDHMRTPKKGKDSTKASSMLSSKSTLKVQKGGPPSARSTTKVQGAARPLWVVAYGHQVSRSLCLLEGWF